MTNLVLIPARMASTRLPGKPLADIAGKPMILHVAERARAADIGRVVVATDSPDIRRIVEAAGFEAVMTGGHHPSGSDRIFEALTLLDAAGEVEYVINLQGDLPTIEPATIREILRPLADPACDIATLATPAGEAERSDPSVVKLVGSPIGEDRVRALYFTRATAPSGEGPLLHHIGIYAYRRRALERFVTLGPSTLEMRESLEQLRALEAGMRIDAAIVDAVPFGVDTAAQLEEARRRFAGAGGATNRIAFQGEPGANSDTACRDRYPEMQPLPCPTFEDAFAAVTKGEADLAMIPIENTIAGRVADIHHLLPDSGLKIVGEYFLPIRFQLMAKRGTTLEEIREVHSHIHALGQCRGILRRNGWKPVVSGDTAGAARIVSEMADRGVAALAPRLAAELYGLDILAEDVEDAEHNTTRFVVLSRAGQEPRALHAPSGNGPTLTTFVFEVRNLPAALYKAMGGFATNSVNMTKLESYQLGGQFTATQFYADIEGHPDDVGVANALEELAFFTKRLTILGVYPAAPNRT